MLTDVEGMGPCEKERPEARLDSDSICVVRRQIVLFFSVYICLSPRAQLLWITFRIHCLSNAEPQTQCKNTLMSTTIDYQESFQVHSFPRTTHCAGQPNYASRQIVSSLCYSCSENDCFNRCVFYWNINYLRFYTRELNVTCV